MPRRSKKTSFASRVKAIVDSKTETKHINTESGTWDSVSGAGVTFDIASNVAQGAADHQRVGDLISVKKLHVSRMFRLIANVTQAACTIRFIVAKAKGRTLVNGDMPNFYSPCNLDLMYVLSDKLFTITGTENTAGTGYVPNATKRINFSKSWRSGLPVHYSGGSTTVVKNQVIIYWIADTGNVVEEAGYTSLYFKDG